MAVTNDGLETLTTQKKKSTKIRSISRRSMKMTNQFHNSTFDQQHKILQAIYEPHTTTKKI